MTQAQFVPQDHMIKAIAIISDDDGKSHTTVVDGWSSMGETEQAKRGLVVAVDDNIEVIIPVGELMKFVKYLTTRNVA